MPIFKPGVAFFRLQSRWASARKNAGFFSISLHFQAAKLYHIDVEAANSSGFLSESRLIRLAARNEPLETSKGLRVRRPARATVGQGSIGKEVISEIESYR